LLRENESLQGTQKTKLGIKAGSGPEKMNVVKSVKNTKGKEKIVLGGGCDPYRRTSQELEVV